MIRLRMKKEPQYNIIRGAAKISSSSSGKTGQYECVTGEKILSSNQKQVTEQDTFTYSPLGKAFGNKLKQLKIKKKNKLML